MGGLFPNLLQNIKEVVQLRTETEEAIRSVEW